MADWNDFERAVPELGQLGRSLLYRTNEGLGLLATVRAEHVPPRIHPVNLEILDGRLLTFIHDDSAKARDLIEDGRYAVHAHQDPRVPHEFQVRGHATLVTETERRRPAAEAWPFRIDETFLLFELGIDHALVGRRASADDWPPVYRSWRALTPERVG
jgi:hypothetical protein